MNEIKDICDRLLDAPSPPLRRADEVLAAARRARNRVRLAVTGSGVAALAVLGLCALLAGQGVLPGADAATQPTAVTPSATGFNRLPIGGVPPALARPAHGRQLDKMLREAVPPGFTLRSGSGTGWDDDYPTYRIPPKAKPGQAQAIAWMAGAEVLIGMGDATGNLTANIQADGWPVPDDPCVLSADRRGSLRTELAGRACRVIEVGGIPIAVFTTQNKYRGEGIVAVRFLRGGYLIVESWQGLMPYFPGSHKPPVRTPMLTQPVLSAQRVAELAADPRMLP